MADERRSTYRRLLVELGVMVVVLVGVIYLISARSRPDPEGFRLQAQTMVPSDGPIWLDEVDCPSRQSPSPVDFDSASALADELRVYESELLFARIRLTPYEGRVPEQVTFDATWPQDSVTAGSPVCAFLVDDDVGAPILSWRRTGERAAEFVLDDPRPYGPTVVEVWLRAEPPTPNATFLTSLSTDVSGDSVIVEPLGGRINIDARPSAAVAAELSSTVTRVRDDTVEITVAVPNPIEDTLSLDTTVRLGAGAGISWTAVDVPTGIRCDLAEIAICEFGDIPGGETVTVVLDAVLPPDWAPTTDPACRTSDGRLRIGLCVVAETSSTGLESPAETALLVDASGPINSPISVRLDPDPLIVRRGQLASVSYLVSAIGDDDLGSVEVIGSDCIELTRVPGSLDDDDAFLEVGEIWQYECSLEAASSRTFRLDLVARSETARPVTASTEGVLTVIDPRLEVSTRADGALTTVTVRNSGDDVLTDVAVVIPGCSSQPTPDADPGRLAVGAAINFSCERTDDVLDEPKAYATDSSGAALSTGN